MLPLIGTHRLTYIGGFAGANAMFDTWISDGKWISSGSEIVAAMREGYYNDLTQEDIDILNSTYIKIDSSLTLFVVLNNKEIIKSAYQPNGMDYQIRDTTESSIIDFLKEDKLVGVNSSTIFYQGTNILLLAVGKMNWEKEFQTSFYNVLSDHMLITYQMADSTFDIEFFEGQCCSNGHMVFTK